MICIQSCQTTSSEDISDYVKEPLVRAPGNGFVDASQAACEHAAHAFIRIRLSVRLDLTGALTFPAKKQKKRVKTAGCYHFKHNVSPAGGSAPLCFQYRASNSRKPPWGGSRRRSWTLQGGAAGSTLRHNSDSKQELEVRGSCRGTRVTFPHLERGGSQGEQSQGGEGQPSPGREEA